MSLGELKKNAIILPFSIGTGFFPTRLKALRENKKINQTELASVLKVNQRTVSSWEKGRAEPAFKHLAELAEYFEVDINFMLCLDHETFEAINLIAKINGGTFTVSDLNYCNQMVSETQYTSLSVYNSKISTLEIVQKEISGIKCIDIKRRNAKR